MDSKSTDEMQCVFDDIFAFTDRAICHLRVYDVGDDVVVLAVKLEDNDGTSVVNDADDLADRVRAVFARPCHLFAAFGDDPFGDWIQIHHAEGARATFDTKIPHAEIEAMLGTSLPVPTSQTAAEATTTASTGQRSPTPASRS